MISKREDRFIFYTGLVIFILVFFVINAAGESVSDGMSGTQGSLTNGRLSLPADNDQIIIGVIAPLSETSSICTPASPCRVADLSLYQEQLTAQEHAYLLIISEYAPDSLVAFYPVRSSDDTARTSAIHSLLSSGIDIIVEDIGSAYSPFMKKGALSDQISLTLSQYPDVSFGGLIHDENCNVDILPQGKVDFSLDWSGEGSLGKKAEYYLHLIDRDTGKQLGLGTQSTGSDGAYSSILSYHNQGTDIVRSQLKMQSGSDVLPEDVRLSAWITPNTVFINDIVFFPEKGSVKEMTQPEFVTITRIQQKGTGSGVDDDLKTPDTSGFPVPTGPFLFISALPDHSLQYSETTGNPGYVPADTQYSSIYEHSIQGVFNLMVSIRDKILKKTSDIVTMQPGLTEISGPVVLSKPGSYVLSSDIIASDEVIIDIRSSGVSIDGNGHMIEGRTFFGGMNDPVFQTGIAVDSGTQLSDIHITNLIISGTYDGIRIDSTSDLQINSCTIDATTQGIVVDASDRVLVDSCLISSSGATGIVILDGKNTSITGNTIEGGVNGISIKDSENISLIANEITDTVYSPILQEGTNTNIIISDELV